jgi:hypothetical protein
VRQGKSSDRSSHANNLLGSSLRRAANRPSLLPKTSAFGVPQAGMCRINLLQIHCVFDFDRVTKTSVIITSGDDALTQSARIHIQEYCGSYSVFFYQEGCRTDYFICARKSFESVLTATILQL